MLHVQKLQGKNGTIHFTAVSNRQALDNLPSLGLYKVIWD